MGPEHKDRLRDIGNCPTPFQQYIPGADYRVHVVGDRVFAAQIVSDADDYRYAGRPGGRREIRTCTLEPELRERCRRLAADLGSLFAGIDLRRSPEGRWYCFEVNPSPGFTFYQEATGQKIADGRQACWLTHERKPYQQRGTCGEILFRPANAHEVGFGETAHATKRFEGLSFKDRENGSPDESYCLPTLWFA